MYTRVKALTLAVAFVLCTGVFSARAQEKQPDRIFVYGQSQPRKGRVIEEGLNELTWKPLSPGGSGGYLDSTNTSWRKIRTIRFGEQPENFQKAKAILRQGQSVEEAISLLDEIIEKREVNRAFFIPRAMYLKANIRYKLASDDEGYRKALEVYKKANDQYDSNRGYFDGVQREIELLEKLGELEKALEVADELIEKNPRSRGEAIGSLIKAQIYTRQKKHDQAVDQYRRAVSKTGASGQNTFQIKARAGLGNSVLKTGDYANARRQFKQILDQKQFIQKQGGKQFLVAAHNGLGRALFKQEYNEDAESKKARKQNVKVLKDALLHFMRGVVWYNAPKSGSTKAFERSLYWTALTFSKLEQNVQNKEDKKGYNLEARRALNTLFSRYPETVFRKQAKELQRKL